MQISEHHVRECAYYIWENEGRLHGYAAAHWLRAETELRANATLAAGAAAEPTVKAAAPKAAKSTVKSTAKPAAKAPSKAVATKNTASKDAAPKAAAPKADKPAAKPAAPKTARASKTAVTAGLAAKAKPARAPASMH